MEEEGEGACNQICHNNADEKPLILKRPYSKVRVVATDLAELNLNVNPGKVQVEYEAFHPMAFNAVTGEVAEGLSDATLVGGAFNEVFGWGNIGQRFVAIAMFLFAFTTVLGWSHYGSKAWEYLFGAKTTVIFRIIHVCTIIFGAVLTSSLAWDISDTFNGLMMIPNLIGVLALSPLVVKITKNYVDRKLKHKQIEPMISKFPDIQKMQAEALARGEEE